MDPQTSNAQQVPPSLDNGQSQGQFPPSEPPKSKKTGLVLGIIAAVIVVAVIAFMALGGSDKKDNGDAQNTNGNSNSNSSSDEAAVDSKKFQKYDVADKALSANYSVSFYKDATIVEKSGRTFLTSGEEGSQYSVYLSSARGDKLDCGGTPSTTMRLNGQSATVCYESKNMQYASYVTVNRVTRQLNLAGQKAISMEDAKAILESVTFK